MCTHNGPEFIIVWSYIATYIYKYGHKCFPQYVHICLSETQLCLVHLGHVPHAPMHIQHSWQ